MFKIITMCDSNYFGAGKLFLETRHRINADFVLHGPDLTQNQINIVNKHKIDYVPISPDLYKNEMQFLKFGLVESHILLDKKRKYKGFTLADFDTFFINDWSHIFDYDFDYGITVRNDMVKKKCLRAYANGGVVFAKHSSYQLLKFAQQIVLAGKSDDLIEYDRIWRTLETGRPKHKTHYRNVLRWWVDQIFLSAIVLRYFKTHGYQKIGLKPTFFKYQNYKIGLFGCRHYNVLDSGPNISKQKNIYIRHLKSAGRKTLGVKRTQEKLKE